MVMLSLPRIFCYFSVFEFLRVKSDARALREALGFQLQLDGCKHEVMIAANVGAWGKFCVCFVDSRLEALGRQDEVYLVVNLGFTTSLLRSTRLCVPHPL